MYRTALIARFAPAPIDTQHASNIALVHDLAEAIVGDITPLDPISKSEKSRRETETMQYLSGHLASCTGMTTTAKEILACWKEYEENLTPASKFVHDVDKLEMLLQMVEYEAASGGNLDLSEFAAAADQIHTPEVKQWAEVLLSQRRT